MSKPSRQTMEKGRDDRPHHVSPTEEEERLSLIAQVAEQARSIKIFQQVALALGAEQDLHKVVQHVTDAGRELSGAAFGAFFYNVVDPAGESYVLYTLSGAPAEAFSAFPMPRNTEIFAPTFEGQAPVRLADVTQDPRFGHNAPYFGMPAGHLPVKSYLAVSVISPSGGVLGGLFYGHPEPNVFHEETEQYVTALAAQAAIAIENGRLREARRREMEALRSSDENGWRLAAIVQSSDDAIISKSLDGIIRTWNAGAERLFGYTPEEIIGKPVTVLFPPDHVDEETVIIGRIKRGERIEHYETLRRHKDGRLLDISLTISPILDAQGAIVGASKIARDISQRKRNEEALVTLAEELAHSRELLEQRVEERTASLRDAITQVEEFSYTVSHDVRAPIRAMGIHCQALMEDHRQLFEGQGDAWHSLERIRDNCQRLDRMTRDVLTYGRVARGEITLAPVSLDHIVAQTIAAFPEMQSPLAQIHVDHLGTVLGSEALLNQVVSNLLGNAVKFVPKGQTPEVRIWTETVGGRVRMHIQDNGIGIDPALHHRLFGIFERLHPHQPYEGTGVGLAIVRKAVEKMGGKIGVESDGENGTVFWVELPGVTADPA